MNETDPSDRHRARDVLDRCTRINQFPRFSPLSPSAVIARARRGTNLISRGHRLRNPENLHRSLSTCISKERRVPPPPSPVKARARAHIAHRVCLVYLFYLILVYLGEKAMSRGYIVVRKYRAAPASAQRPRVFLRGALAASFLFVIGCLCDSGAN